jgi:rhodanese-related sulfurtransferase
MRRLLFGCVAGLVIASLTVVLATAENQINLVVDGESFSVEPAPAIINSRVFVPIRFAAETLNCEVNWDAENRAVVITRSAGSKYLRGLNDPAVTTGDIMRNLVKSTELRDALDDDGDRDLADYREGHNGGDFIGNDPLIVDLRSKQDYDAGHIPTAVWVDTAPNIAEPQNVNSLKDLLNAHIQKGGKDEIVLYCYTGNTSGLACGVLGAQGLNVKTLRFGYDIAWVGTKTADRPVRATVEDVYGKASECGG